MSGREATVGAIDDPTPDTGADAGNVWISGWAIGPDDVVGPGLLLLVDGRLAERPGIGLERPELAEAHPGRNVARAGWHASLDLRWAAGRTVQISLLAAVPGGWTELDRCELHVPALRRSGCRARAAFTIVQNESYFLPLWLDYYGRHFDPEDLFVLDHDSGDASTRGIDDRCNVVPVHRSASFDHRWLEETVASFQAFLLGSYETVLFAEADEFLVADPAHHAGLGAYIEALDAPTARATGFNLVHYRDEGEAPLRLDRPILEQRAHWHPSPNYSKTLVAKVPLRWSIGFHQESGAPATDPDPELVLVHLHRADYERCLARHRSAAARDWNDEDVRRGFGKQNRVAEPEEFERWFYRGEDLEGSDPEPIPDRWRAAL